jgi:hypothetical protein
MTTAQESLLTAHPLDNVIWQALSSRQAGFAQGAGGALRFVPEVGPLAGFATPEAADFEALAELATTGAIALFLDAPFKPRPGWNVVYGAPLVQMVWDKDEAREITKSALEIEKTNGVEVLGAADSGAMIELTQLTKPGPFGARTHELGSFFGIRREGGLAAMAGERLESTELYRSKRSLHPSRPYRQGLCCAAHAPRHVGHPRSRRNPFSAFQGR